MFKQTILLPLASFHDFVIQNPSPHYCTSLKMLSSFLDSLGPLLVLTNTINEEFCLHFLRDFLITLAYPSIIFLRLFLLCPLRHPPAVPRAMGRLSTTPYLPLLTISTADSRLETPRHQSAWFTNHYGQWPLPPAPQRSTPHSPQGAIGPERVERLYLFIAIHMLEQKIVRNGGNTIWQQWLFGPTRLNSNIETSRAM